VSNSSSYPAAKRLPDSPGGLLDRIVNLDRAVFVGAVYEIGSVGRAGAFEHLGKVLCHRVPAHVEFLTDLDIRQPASNKLEDGTLTSCERCEPSVVVHG
jgi:hypothetical protein